jgi:hypothetical protein
MSLQQSLADKVPGAVSASVSRTMEDANMIPQRRLAPEADVATLEGFPTTLVVHCGDVAFQVVLAIRHIAAAGALEDPLLGVMMSLEGTPYEVELVRVDRVGSKRLMRHWQLHGVDVMPSSFALLFEL